MDYDSDSVVQKQLDAAMPWVGLYIAVANAVCTLAMAVDAVISFRQKKFWFPCKYSSLNSASLTVLALAMKLPMDLNTVMIKSETDAAAKFMSLTFMSTVVINIMSSLGSMHDKEVLANVVGLGVLVITIMGNVSIQFIELRRFLKPGTISLYILIPSALMLSSLVGLVSLAVAVSTIKRNLKWMYQNKLKATLNEEEVLLWQEGEKANDEILGDGRELQPSVCDGICNAFSIICCFGYMVVFSISRIRGTNTNKPGESPPYGIYTRWIVYIQSSGMAIGVIVAMLRWLSIIMLRCSTTCSNSFKDEFKIEGYWIQTLKDWRNSFSGSQISPNRFRKYFHNAKWCVLTLCIRIQVFIVLISKMVLIFSVFILRPFLSFFSHIRQSVSQTEHNIDTDLYLNLSRYAVLLEGEAELPPSFLKSMRVQADHIFLTGQPSSLLNLLQKSGNFKGVGEYNCSQIPSLLSEDPPDCWTLPVVTLTTIAIALPNISHDKRKQLLGSVREGLSLAKIVEKTLDTSAKLKNIREAARLTWVEVLLYSKWLHIDLTRAFLHYQSSNEVLHELSDNAEGIVTEFIGEGLGNENPVNLPAKVVAANSMYRICQTILVSFSCVDEKEEMLERICVMIADILAACLTNLPHAHALAKMCHQNSIEKRERSVREAFLLLGKTEKVMEVVRQQQPPSLDHDKAANIEEWRSVFSFKP